MSTLIPIDDASNEIRAQVISLTMQGKTPRAIAGRLGIKVVEAQNYWKEYQILVRQDHESTDIAKEYLDRMVKHYDDLISRSYDNLEELHVLDFDEKVSAQINATLKNIADYEARRLDTLHKAGLLDDGALGDELAKREEREHQILEILRKDLCPACQAAVRDKLTKLTGVIEGTVVDG